LDSQRKTLSTQHDDFDLKLRIVKSRLEEAWYDYDSAVLAQQSTQPARQRIEELDKVKEGIQKGFDQSQAQLDQIDKELNEVRSEVKALEDKWKSLTSTRDDLEQKLENISIAVGPFHFPKIPKIRQVVLEDFERNNFDKPIARVDRCE